MRVSEIGRVLVVGAGAMGHGIALVYAMGGYEVDLVDIQSEALDRADTLIQSSLSGLVSFGAVESTAVEPILRRIARTTDLERVAPRADLAIEAIVEDPQEKSALFATLETLLPRDTMIASNTSGLDVFTLAARSSPSLLSRLVIHHFFLPPTIVPLVEVVPGPETSAEDLAFSVALLESLGRTPIVLDRFAPNFIVNRYQIALGTVTAQLLQEGIATPEMIDRAVKHSLGVRLPIVGVVQSLDFTGLELF
ncbi:MAG: 3-hydroxyacyl-CoA dehydrogenase family protein, partial [Isosphaeraceae bacterium]